MKLEHKIVAIVGMCGSGKSIATNVFCERGWEKVYFGGLTMDKLEEMGLAKTEANEKMVRENLRKEHGPGAFAKLLLPKIEKLAKESHTVLDGLYSWSEYKELTEYFGDNLSVLAVVTNRPVRYERLTTREIRPLTNDEAKSRDFAEIEKIEKGGPIAIADYFVLNNGDMDAFETELNKIIDEITSK